MVTRKPLELWRARVRLYDCVVATTSKAAAQKALGTKDVERYFEASLARRATRRPGVVFKKLHGVKRKFEAWD